MLNHNFHDRQNLWEFKEIWAPIRISDSVSERMARCKGLAPTVKSALRMKAHEINTIEGAKKLNFHVHRKSEDFLLRLALVVNDINEKTLELSSLRLFDFAAAQETYRGLHSQKQFIDDLARFTRVEAIESEEDIPNDPPWDSPAPEAAESTSNSLGKWAPNATMYEAEEAIPKALIFNNNTTVKLSAELIKGLEGKRGFKHRLDISILKQCLGKKIKKLKAEKKVPRSDFYFKITKNGEASGVLNLIVQKYFDTNTLVVGCQFCDIFA